ncbi:hypothetical protein M153_2100052583 [Pseudoloma neurophilia]|uniref:Uncharacterized protein n=1 Tax=Pseudoloma neurophilia TaxID=146866 RepID=A0A0R0M6P4_9MICR|nr:hypothetical protein M153_2100052583 [Pseudoloma neurophilia]
MAVKQKTIKQKDGQAVKPKGKVKIKKQQIKVSKMKQPSVIKNIQIPEGIQRVTTMIDQKYTNMTHLDFNESKICFDVIENKLSDQENSINQNNSNLKNTGSEIEKQHSMEKIDTEHSQNNILTENVISDQKPRLNLQDNKPSKKMKTNLRKMDKSQMINQLINEDMDLIDPKANKLEIFFPDDPFSQDQLFEKTSVNEPINSNHTLNEFESQTGSGQGLLDSLFQNTSSTDTEKDKKEEIIASNVKINFSSQTSTTNQLVSNDLIDKLVDQQKSVPIITIPEKYLTELDELINLEDSAMCNCPIPCKKYTEPTKDEIKELKKLTRKNTRKNTGYDNIIIKMNKIVNFKGPESPGPILKNDTLFGKGKIKFVPWSDEFEKQMIEQMNDLNSKEFEKKMIEQMNDLNSKESTDQPEDIKNTEKSDLEKIYEENTEIENKNEKAAKNINFDSLFSNGELLYGDDSAEEQTISSKITLSKSPIDEKPENHRKVLKELSNTNKSHSRSKQKFFSPTQSGKKVIHVNRYITVDEEVQFTFTIKNPR